MNMMYIVYIKSVLLQNYNKLPKVLHGDTHLCITINKYVMPLRCAV